MSASGTVHKLSGVEPAQSNQVDHLQIAFDMHPLEALQR